MCGIAGIYHFQNNKKISQKVLEAMLLGINHRGPDERGIYLSNHIGLANARLSIIDLATGQQPMRDRTGNNWIVFNGEIFNYIELRQELEDDGYVFKTKSDTEIIIASYSLYGSKFLNKLNGQYAFAIWDKRKRSLFLARDRSGICPLFYTIVNGCFVFGSEIKAILQHPDMTPEISINTLCHYLTYWSALTPSTFFKNINELSPGHFMNVSSARISVEPYWKLQFPDHNKHAKISLDQARTEFTNILEDAVRIRLRADVPVASYLSGGIDSTTTTAIIKSLQPNLLNTFSIGFSDQTYDESEYQQEAARYFKTNHLSIKCSNSDIINAFKKVIWHSESPVLRTAPAPMYNLSKFVRKNNIKVVITGEGADELLGGYDIFKEMLIRRFWARYPDSKLRPLLLKKLYPFIPQITNSSGTALKLFYGYKLDEIHHPAYSHFLRWNNGFHIMKYLHPSHKEVVEKFNPYHSWLDKMPEGFNNWGHLSKAQYLEFTLFMSGYLLSAQGDRMTMANSVEGRYPFLDHRLIEFAARLPEEFKIKGLNEKFLLKKTMENKIPSSIINRPKQAYRAPAGNIFFEHSMNDLEFIISNPVIKKYEIFDASLVSEIIEKIKRTGKSTEIENMIITAVISTQLLCHLFIDGAGCNMITPASSKLSIVEDYIE